MRPVVRTLIAVLLAGSCAMLAATTAAASVQKSQQPSGITDRAGSHSLTLSIDSVSPRQYATSTSTVTVHGTLLNNTGSAIPDLQVQLQSYPWAFETRTAMTAYASGGPIALQFGTVAALQSMGTADALSGTLANGATARWTVSFNPVQDYGLDGVTPGFGVYPLQVAAASTGSGFQGARYQATSQSFLPYWPGEDATTKPTPLQVAWVWPLIDTPQQGACPQVLTTPSLAGSLAAGGRLDRLLAVGAQWTQRDDLTWAIDPALLSDATVMTQPYSTGGNSECTGRTSHPASPAAVSWLSALRMGTAGQSAFATPYADVDVSALSHAGLDASLHTAYDLGRTEAKQVLPGTFGGKGSIGGTTDALAAAWPAGGTADTGVLTSLAREGGISTVVLSSNELPTSAPDYDNALARTKTSSGTSMSVLLADAGITGILGSASARSSASAQFAVTQDFLAQTAMILSQAPDLSRSLVVAPPAGWNPSSAEAAQLLRLTKNAPWLRATGLGTLASEAARVATRKLRPRKVSSAELSGDYLSHIRSLNASLGLYQNLLSQPSPSALSSLDAAAAVTESAAWRGSGSYGGWLALTQLGAYLNDQKFAVRMIASSKLLLAGTSGTIPVSVENTRNALGAAVEVRVVVTTPPGSNLRVGSYNPVLKVGAGRTGTVGIPVTSTSALGTTTIQLQLMTANGTPLTWTTHTMSVEVTRFGRTLLVIIAGALGVLVLTAVVRLRRKRRAADGRHGGDGSGDSADGKTDSRAHAGGAG